MRRGAAVVASVLVAATAVGAVRADNGIRIGPYSGQVDPGRAVVGARITKQEASGSRSTRSAERAEVIVSLTTASTSDSPAKAPRYPTLASDSSLFRNPAPFGPGTFWYGGPDNVSCVYAAGSSPLCYTITGAAAGAARAALNPAGIAAAVADRLELGAGELHTSPAARGVTGAESWFWLDPAPTERQLSTSLGGETVTVTATPSVRWQFGDDSALAGGAGVPYMPGTPPPDAIVHVFQTRCLAGDRGRNPYVLASCASDGYRLRASVSWEISYSATGPVSASGTLPARTTETSVAYPVSEVRGFLVGGETG